jgi:hypothetical protein
VSPGDVPLLLSHAFPLLGSAVTAYTRGVGAQQLIVVLGVMRGMAGAERAVAFADYVKVRHCRTTRTPL